MSDQNVIASRDLDPATADAHAQGFAAIIRQVGVRHGRGALLCEAAACIMASAMVLAELCGPEGVRDTMAWHSGRATVLLGPETSIPFSLTDDGLALPEPRPIGVASHHIVRNLRAIVRSDGIDQALEITAGILRAGIAIIREETDAQVVALVLDQYAGNAATLAAMEPDELAAMMPEQVH